ncbi:MAG TPA: glycosyltransferase family A protein [Pyrinomonadaceae bacterium]|nr:glycosyltransferase family A protein [Pyrinomonadaceae bacterium]
MGGIDVVIPSYQYGHFLRESVGSVLSQSVENLRVLIIDNGSTDNTREIAEEMARDDPRVELVVHKRNLSPLISYNEGIDWASSELFMILDADDVMMPGCLLRAAAIMSADRNIAFAHGKGVQTDSPAAIIAKQTGKAQPEDWRVCCGLEFIDRVCRTGNCIISPPTVVRRTSMQKATGYYPLELQRAIDLNMWLRLATFGSVAETTAIQGIHRRHPNQLSAFYRDNLVCDFVELLNNFEHFFMNEGGWIQGSLATRHATAKKLASNAFVAAVKRLLKGRVSESGKLFEFAYSTWRKSRSYRTNPAPLSMSQ